MGVTPVSRRQALLSAAALLVGAPMAALAKSGDSPKISVFGVGGQSSPFTAGVKRGGKVLYSTLGDDEVAVFKRIIAQSKERLELAAPSIKAKSWEDIRSRIRLEASDLRKTQLTVNASIEDAAQNKKAENAYKTFKKDLESLDQACIQKNQDRAYKGYNASLKSLSAWEDITGF